jgi:hypothetical protein
MAKTHQLNCPTLLIFLSSIYISLNKRFDWFNRFMKSCFDSGHDGTSTALVFDEFDYIKLNIFKNFKIVFHFRNNNNFKSVIKGKIYHC